MTAVTETAPDLPALSMLLDQAQDAIEFERERADAAEARAAEYENAVTWETSCTSCARVLDSCARETERRERAEAELGELVDRVGSVIAAAGAVERRRADAAEAETARLRALLEGKPGEVRPVADEEEEALLTPGEAALMFRVHPSTLTRWAAAGKLTSVRTTGNHRRYREAEVRALLHGNGNAP